MTTTTTNSQQNAWFQDHPICPVCKDQVHYRSECVEFEGKLTHLLCVIPDLYCTACRRKPTKHEVVGDIYVQTHTTCQYLLTVPIYE